MKPASVLVLSTALLACSLPVYAQTTPGQSSNPAAQDSSQTSPDQQAGVVSPGTRFLIRLDGAISTKTAKPGEEFRAHTLDPLATPDGLVLRPGAGIRGHVDKVEQARQVGRARIWLAFDDITTPRGWLPLVAVVSDVPGIQSVRVVYEREGEIESRTSKSQEEAEAAAAGALVGAAPGVAEHSRKGAAIGAATGAVTAFMISSGLGQEFTLQKGTKLELVLDHPLYLAAD
jgi:hypothetical protein